MEVLGTPKYEDLLVKQRRCSTDPYFKETKKVTYPCYQHTCEIWNSDIEAGEQRFYQIQEGETYCTKPLSNSAYFYSIPFILDKSMTLYVSLCEHSEQPFNTSSNKLCLWYKGIEMAFTYLGQEWIISDVHMLRSRKFIKCLVSGDNQVQVAWIEEQNLCKMLLGSKDNKRLVKTTI